MIKRIVITIKPAKPNSDWTAFCDFIVSTYPNGEYAFSPGKEEISDLCYVFYGQSETDIVQYFREQTDGEPKYPTHVSWKTRDVTRAEWDVLSDEHDLSLPVAMEGH